MPPHKGSGVNKDRRVRITAQVLVVQAMPEEFREVMTLRTKGTVMSKDSTLSRTKKCHAARGGEQLRRGTAHSPTKEPDGVGDFGPRLSQAVEKRANKRLVSLPVRDVNVLALRFYTQRIVDEGGAGCPPRGPGFCGTRSRYPVGQITLSASVKMSTLRMSDTGPSSSTVHRAARSDVKCLYNESRPSG
eukprot:6173577-Pleurochrysis_carterae.AAC.1